MGIRRKRYAKLPLQANFYPLPSLGYVQDAESRLSLVSSQPLGGTSGASGQIEVMLDRRLMQEDDQGMQPLLARRFSRFIPIPPCSCHKAGHEQPPLQDDLPAGPLQGQQPDELLQASGEGLALRHP